MSKFTYTLPSGDQYVMLAPDNTTQDSADRVFYEQVAAGSLVGYSAGQTLAGTTLLPKTFELSRLDRGTAGVVGTVALVLNSKVDILNNILNSVSGDNPGKLPSSINNILSNVSIWASSTGAIDSILNDVYSGNQPGLTATITNSNFEVSKVDVPTLLSIIESLPIIAGMPSLVEVPITEPVTQADIMLAKGQSLGPVPVGPLSSFQVQALEAQVSNIVNQSVNDITQEKGIGKYGFTCYQLEKVGYVKPGTSERFIEPTPNNFVSVMKSPSIWTGYNGVNSLDDILGNDNLQNTIQNQLMESGYEGLIASGVISNISEPAAQTNIGWVYTGTGLQQSGLQQTTPISSIGGDTGILGTILSEPTTNFSTLGSGVVSSEVSSQLDINTLNYNTASKNISDRVIGDVGALVTNASKFGPEVTSIWATAGNNNNFSDLLNVGVGSVNSTNSLINQLGGVKSLLSGGISTVNPLVNSNSFVETLPSQLNSVVNNFTNFGAAGLSGIPTNVSSYLTNPTTAISGVLNSFGKAGQFSINATTLSSSVGDLTSLSKLSDLAAGSFNNFTDTAGSALNNLQGMASNSLSDIGNNLSNVGDNIGNLTDVGKLTGLLGKFGNLDNLLGGLGGIGKLFGGNDALVSGVKIAGGFSDTVNRTTLDSAVTKILGNPKIPAPTFGYPSPAATGFKQDIAQAKSFLSNIGDKVVNVGYDIGNGASNFFS